MKRTCVIILEEEESVTTAPYNITSPKTLQVFKKAKCLKG